MKNLQLEDTIKNKAWEKENGKFILPFPQTVFSNQSEKEFISNNFARLGQKMFESALAGFNWEKPLAKIAQKFTANKIEWYIVGSICDTVRGINVKPSDIDIVVHTRDFQKAKDLCYSDFTNAIIAPFDVQGRFMLQCFGRIFLDGALVEIAADERWNLENRQSKCEESVWRVYKQPEYTKIVWQGYDLYIESIQYKVLHKINQ